MGERLHREGPVHAGTELAFAGKCHRIGFMDLVGKTVTVYGQTIECDHIAGCDGFHGVCRASIPAERLRTYPCRPPAPRA